MSCCREITQAWKLIACCLMKIKRNKKQMQIERETDRQIGTYSRCKKYKKMAILKRQKQQTYKQAHRRKKYKETGNAKKGRKIQV